MIYTYGITFKNGITQLCISEKNITDFMDYLKSAEWVGVKYKVKCDWITNDRSETTLMDYTMVSLANIESIDFENQERCLDGQQGEDN